MTPVAAATLAFNAAVNLGSTTGTSFSHAYTVGSGTNRILFACFEGDNVGGNDDITSVTYNGQALTLAGKGTAVDRFIYLYYLVNPASGSNTFSAAWTNSHFFQGGAADYSGAAQTSPIDGVNTGAAASGNPTTMTFTTAVANDWGILCVRAGGFGTLSAPGYVNRETDLDTTILDSNGVIPTGSQSVSVTSNQTPTWNWVATGVKP